MPRQSGRWAGQCDQGVASDEHVYLYCAHELVVSGHDECGPEPRGGIWAEMPNLIYKGPCQGYRRRYEAVAIWLLKVHSKSRVLGTNEMAVCTRGMNKGSFMII